MRKLIVAALIASTVAAPAAAQYRGGHDGRGRSAGIERQVDQLERQIDRLRDRRLISANEAFRLSRQAQQIDRLHLRYRRDGLSPREASDLQQRIVALRDRVQDERQEGRHDRRR